MLRSDREIHEAFQMHFHDCFSRLSYVPAQVFRSYLADFPCLQEAESVSCEDLLIECEVCDVLNQVNINKSLELDVLPKELYLRMLHIFVPVLTDVFSH